MSVKMAILAVLGAGEATEEERDVAASVGRLAAERGWVVLTGGGPGVMEAASRAAVENGGLTVGVLPMERPAGAYPNPWVKIPIFTGVGNARNVFNVLSADLCVAIGGRTGTLSEVALALKAGREIWCWQSWGLTSPDGASCELPRTFESAGELLVALREKMR